MEIEAKISGDYGGAVISSPAVSGAVHTPALSGFNWNRPAKKTVKYKNKTKALLKPIIQICDESPNAKFEPGEEPDNSQWRIFHHNIERCITFPERCIKYFATEVWVITKFHYDIGTPDERRILKVFPKRDDKYATFDIYESWLEWIGECPRPLEDIEELFTI